LHFRKGAAMSNDKDKAVAYALLTEDELAQMGASLKRVFPITEDSPFEDLLRELDRLVTRDTSKG